MVHAKALRQDCAGEAPGGDPGGGRKQIVGKDFGETIKVTVSRAW